MDFLTPADEVDDFVGIVLQDARFGPVRARKNVTVAFDGHALGIDAQMFEKLKNVQAIGNFAGFAVDGDGQDLLSAGLGFGLARST